jgi:hypothetical protein
MKARRKMVSLFGVTTQSSALVTRRSNVKNSFSVRSWPRSGSKEVSQSVR